MSFVQSFLSWLGRLAFAAYFFLVGVYIVRNYDVLVQDMGNRGIHQPQVVLACVAVGLFVGSVLIAMGFGARVGALLVLVYLVGHAFHYQNFWTLDAGTDAYKTAQQEFLNACALAGCALFLLANGGGAGVFPSRRIDDDREMVH